MPADDFEVEHRTWFISRAFEKLRSAEEAIERFERTKCIEFCFEAIEFCLEAESVI